MSDLELSGPTVTVFGDRDALGEALGDELSRRGWSTHEVTTPTGWFGSVTHAVVRLDAPPGVGAIEALAAGHAPPAHLVAVGATTDEEILSGRLEALCRQCGDRHDVSLLWHPPLALGAGDDGPGVLAAQIADEIGRTAATAVTPGFVTRTFGSQDDRGGD